MVTHTYSSHTHTHTQTHCLYICIYVYTLQDILSIYIYTHTHTRYIYTHTHTLHSNTHTRTHNYIGDAHVPLHSTENYNGQKTNQHGIHGFWESRLPELFSDKYDFFVGRAKYIDNVQMAAWAASEGSYAAKDSVLDFERKLNTTFGIDRKYSNEQRGQAMIKVYSKEYSEAYHNMLDNQVERRIRASVLTVGSIWYTAWVDGGQPELINIQQTTKKLTDEERKALISEQQKLLEENKMIGRPEN